MALDDSVLSELLEMFRAGDGLDLIRESVRLVLQELIETEAAEDDRRPALRAHRGPPDRAQRALAPSIGHPGRRRGAEDPQACGPATSSRACWSRGGASTRPSTP
jgi:hypothetical protein